MPYKLSKYPNYKPSGLDWLGDIPEGWEVRRIKDIITNCIYGTSLITKDEGNIQILGMGDIDDGVVSYPNKSFLDNISKEFLLRNGDILFTRTNGSMDLIGKIGLVQNIKENISFASYLVRLRFRLSNNSVYTKYLLNSHSFRDKIRSVAISNAQNNLSSSKYIQTVIPLPPLQTQIKIAKYLDQQTANIDKEIDLLTQKAEKYKQLKQTLISETVTKGLDKTAKLKPSGIEWIGDIPQGWEVKRLKEIFNERVEKNCLTNREPVTENILSVMKDIGVINHRDKGLVGNKMSEDITGYKLVHVDDIVVNKMNVMIGSVGISKEFGALSVIYIILKSKKAYSPKFYNYLFKIKKLQKHLRSISTGILEIREAVNMNLFMGQEFLAPPLQTQKLIADYLDEQTGKIDQIISTINQKIDKLKQYRKVLINDVVVGKVRVEE